MFSKALRDIAKPQWYGIIILLKRSTGMSVSELSKALKMSYMGVKQHCVDLDKKGYLDTWRRPKPVGRPEKLYRLTHKADGLFPGVPDTMAKALLESVKSTYGPTAPDKLLFGYFQKMTEDYLRKVQGESQLERASSFAKIRDSEGYVSDVHYEAGGDLKIIEYHNPLESLMRDYPSMERMEEAMVQKIIGGTVLRTLERNSGLVEYTYTISP